MGADQAATRGQSGLTAIVAVVRLVNPFDIAGLERMAKEQADDLPTRLGVLLALGSSAAFDFKTVSAKRSPMRIVRLATGILALALAAYVLFIGGVLAFGPDAGDASAPNGLARLIGFVLLLLAAAFGWVGWRLVRKRRPIARGEVPDVSNLP